MTHNNRVLQFERLACILAPARTGGRPEPARVPVAISPGRTRNRRGARSGPRRVSLMFPVVGVVRPARLLSLGAAAPAAGPEQAWQAARLGLEVQARLFAFGGVCQFICTGCMKFLKNAASVLANQGQLQHTELRGRFRRPKSQCARVKRSETQL